MAARKREATDQRAHARSCERCARFMRRPGELTLTLVTTDRNGVPWFTHRWLCKRCVADVTKTVAVVVLALVVGSCGGELQRMTTDADQLRHVTHRINCQDGAPVRVLIDPACVDGICGISCAPDRWWPKKEQ